MNVRDFGRSARLYEQPIVEQAIRILYFLQRSESVQVASANLLADYIADADLPRPNVSRLRGALRKRRDVISSSGGFRLHARAIADLGKELNELFIVGASALGSPLEPPLLSTAERELANKMTQIYLLVHLIENSVRSLLRSRLEGHHGNKWWETHCTPRIKRRVAERLAREEKNRWHQPRGAHPINYTDFGDLGDLICTRWDAFKDIFPDQHWVVSRLNEIERSRNVIAHNNVLEDDEITRLELYYRDWCRQVSI